MLLVNRRQRGITEQQGDDYNPLTWPWSGGSRYLWRVRCPSGACRGTAVSQIGSERGAEPTTKAGFSLLQVWGRRAEPLGIVCVGGDAKDWERGRTDSGARSVPSCGDQGAPFGLPGGGWGSCCAGDLGVWGGWMDGQGLPLQGTVPRRSRLQGPHAEGFDRQPCPFSLSSPCRGCLHKPAPPPVH